MKERKGKKIEGYEKEEVEGLMKELNVELKNDVEQKKVYVLNMVGGEYMG